MKKELENSKKNYKSSDHTFAICAYKESPYLASCIKSLLNQSVTSNIIMVTSTPCEYIENIAAKYSIPLYINTGESGIAGDWNYAYEMAKTSLVTIAHQDDIYEEKYTYEILTAANKSKRSIILFTDYGELRNGKRVVKNKLLKVKRIMLWPLKARLFHGSRFVRRRILSMGSPICCPSVCYNKEQCPRKIFTKHFMSDVDWQAWEKLSRLKGSFVYIPSIQMLHRIHEESETTRIIGDNRRSKEDYEMYCKFWPAPIARFIEHFYNKGEQSNNLNE